MKKTLFLIALLFGMVACSPAESIMLSDKNLKYENGAFTYYGKPYTGKLTAQRDEMGPCDRFFIQLKDGHLDGASEIKCKGSELKFTVVNGKFDGDLYGNNSNGKETSANFRLGKLTRLKVVDGQFLQDFTVADDGKVSGTLATGEVTVHFKDGVGKIGETHSMKMQLNDQMELVSEVYEGDKLTETVKDELGLTPPRFERKVITVLLEDDAK